MTKKILGFSLGGVILLIIIIIVGSYVSISGQEIRLRNQVTAQQSVNKVTFDNTWKIIQQQAGVADSYRDDFLKVYQAIMTENKSREGGTLMKFVQESNPNFDIRLREKLANSIEVQRTIFTNEQKKLIDLKREHDNVRLGPISSIFVGGRPEVNIQLVTSDKTENTFASGRENLEK